MKVSGLLSLLFILLLMPQCKEKEKVLFELRYNHKIDVDPTLSTFKTHYFIFDSQQTNALASFVAQSADPETVTTIKPIEARLSDVFQSTSLIFIQDVEIGFFQNDPDDPSDFKLAFYRDNIQSTQDRGLDLFPSLLNLHETLVRDQYNVVIKLTFFTRPPQYMDINLDMIFGVVE